MQQAERVDLIWFDQNINNSENTQYQQKLKEIVTNCKFYSAVAQDHLIFHGIPPILLTGGSCAYNLIQKSNENMILFCGNEKTHIQLFLENKQIDFFTSNFEEVVYYVKLHKQYNKTVEKLENMFLQEFKTNDKQYMHTKEQLSFNFVYIHELIKAKSEVTEDDFNTELLNLVGIESYAIYMQGREKLGNYSLGDKVIYYYSMELGKNQKKFYVLLNSHFASRSYHPIKNSIMILFKLFNEKHKANLQSNNKVKKVYRGLRFSNKKDFDYTLKELQQKQVSFFWNSPTSTSKDRDKAVQFTKYDGCQYGIIFEIELSSQNPHPFYQNIPSAIPNEQEVLLFPQFEFEVVKWEEKQTQSFYSATVFLKQRDNDIFFLQTRIKDHSIGNKELKEKLQMSQMLFQKFFVREQIL